MATVPTIGRATSAGASTASADATRRLFERYGSQILAYCVTQLGNREDAKDATQTTFLNAFRGLERGVSPELESAWLYKIAQNVCLSQQRAASRRLRIEAPQDLGAIQHALPSPAHDSESAAGLEGALRELPEQQRRALLLREWHGLSYREISDELGVSQAAVETLIFRGRRRLARGLDRLRGAGDLGLSALVRNLLLSGGVKVAATLATVSAGTVVAATPAARHDVARLVSRAATFATPAPDTHPSPPARTSMPARGVAEPRAAASPGAKAVVHRRAAVSPPRPGKTIPVVRAPAVSAAAPALRPAGRPAARPESRRAPALLPAPAVSTAAPIAPPASPAPAPTRIGATTPTTTATTPASPPASPPSDTSAPDASPRSAAPAPAAQPARQQPAPTITGFSPAGGPLGTTVQIGGAAFGGVTAVRFNGVPASFTLVSEGWVTARVPDSATSGSIAVTTAAGTATSRGSFVITTPAGSTTTTAAVPAAPVTTSATSGGTTGTTTVSAPPPAVTGFSPSSGSAGTVVQVSGERLGGATAVALNGVAVEFKVSDTQITLRVPDGATSGPITVTSPAGSTTSSGSFTVTPAAPSVAVFSPQGGAAGTAVQIGGSHLTGTSAVTFNGAAATFTVVSDAQITAQVPPGATTGAISVTTAAGTAVSSGTFTVGAPAPTITGFTPRSALSGATVGIAGTHLTGATAVAFNGVPASFAVNSEGQITAQVPAGATSGPISVTTAGGTATSSTAFTVGST